MTPVDSTSPRHKLLQLAQLFRLLWWRIARPHIHGVKAITVNSAGDVLLIRHSYHLSDRWMLPGGGIDKGEDALLAGLRELREETGCTGHDARLLGVLLDRSKGAHNHIHLVEVHSNDTPVADGVEILEARFFRLDDLPATVSAPTARRLAEWRVGRVPAERWED